MRKTKYVASGGLAFTEEMDMKKLSVYASKGWILNGFALLGFSLKKGEPQNIVYSLDYQKDADKEYFAIFEEAGWKHVCSAENEFHVFSAPKETKPIYSDIESMIDKYEREKRQMGRYALPLLIAMILLFALRIVIMNGWITMPTIVGSISLYLGFICLVMLVFPRLPYLAYRFRLIRLRKP